LAEARKGECEYADCDCRLFLHLSVVLPALSPSHCALSRREAFPRGFQIAAARRLKRRRPGGAQDRVGGTLILACPFACISS
jgi:hypothetical protein